MSNISKKKTKKLRSANYAAAGLAGGPAAGRGGGAEVYPLPATAARAEARGEFDYTHVKKDLRRIALLAGTCVAALVALSFIIR
jgi:hypothetical protein